MRFFYGPDEAGGDGNGAGTVATGGDDLDIPESFFEDMGHQARNGDEPPTGDADDPGVEPEKPAADVGQMAEQLTKLTNVVGEIGRVVHGLQTGAASGADTKPSHDGDGGQVDFDNIEQQTQAAIKQAMPDLPDESVAFFSKLTMAGVHTALAPVLEKVGKLEENDATEANEKAVGEFKQLMDGMLDEKEVTDPALRQLLTSHVMLQGMPYGERFTPQIARMLFTKIHGELVKTNHDAAQKYRAGKKTDEDGAPPAAGGNGTVGQPDALKTLVTSEKATDDFLGERFTGAVRSFLGAAEGD